MRRIFTEYVRSLEPGGDPPVPRAFRELMDALRAALVSELKRRGLWDSPPAYLGVYGAESWSAEAAAFPDRAQDPLEELLAECYSFTFVTRLRSLKAHLKVKDNVDGLVFLNIRHFLHERQRLYDPLGYRVFEMLQSGVRDSVAGGELHVLAGDPRIRNQTVLGFTPGAEARVPPAEELREVVVPWNDDLLPELVTAQGRAREKVAAEVRRRLPEIRHAGFPAFRFQEVVDPLKTDVRARWAAILERSEAAAEVREPGAPALAEAMGLLRPDARAEERDLFEKLCACVSDALDELETDGKTRLYLARLWQFLRAFAGEDESLAPGRGRRALAAAQGEDLPSARKLSELLEIPRARFPELFGTLGALVRDCQQAMSSTVAVTDTRKVCPHQGGKGVAG